MVKLSFILIIAVLAFGSTIIDCASTTTIASTVKIDTSQANTLHAIKLANEDIPQRQPGVSDRGLGITYKELKATILEEIKGLEYRRLQCFEKEGGYYYNIESSACESCEKKCDSEQKLGNCGIDCGRYFSDKRANAKYKDLEQKIHMNHWIAILGASLALAAMGVVLYAYYKFRAKANTIDDIERKINNLPPISDRDEKDPLFANPTQEQGQTTV